MDEFEWDVLHEGQLLDAMVGHKPVGINRYFQMAFIWDKLTENAKRDVQSTNIWTHLESLYNLPLLDKAEALPFPNEEREFYLPESDFGILKQKIDEKKNQKGRETPKILKEIKKEETKTPRTNTKEIQRRDSKDCKDVKVISIKKEIKKEHEKSKINKPRNSTPIIKDEQKTPKNKLDEMLKPVKRPTRGSLSLKSDEGNNGGKAASPITVVTNSNTKRRRI